MAQLRHNHFLDTVDAVFNHARAQHILHLHADPAGFDGRFIQIEGQRLKHFGTTSYLGLGLDERIKKAAISAEMLDTANTYDDKVAVIRMIVSDEAGRVSNVFKSMMSRDMS